MKIALLSHVASVAVPTGAERSLALLAGGLAARGHEVTVVAPGPWALGDAVRERGVAVEIVPSRACWLTYWEPCPAPVAAAKWIRWTLPDRSVARLVSCLRRLAPAGRNRHELSAHLDAPFSAFSR